MSRCFILFLVLFILWPPDAVIVRGSVRNTCYLLKPNTAQIGEFCRSHVPSEYRVCAMNSDDAINKLMRATSVIKDMSESSCRVFAQDLCRTTLLLEDGLCPGAGLVCSKDFQDECSEDADCKATVYECCHHCESVIRAVQCSNIDEGIIDAECIKKRKCKVEKPCSSSPRHPPSILLVLTVVSLLLRA